VVGCTLDDGVTRPAWSLAVSLNSISTVVE
jgi:hypothetical protein